MYLCQYKDIFGAPNTGLHSYRLLDIAIVDLVATLVAAFLIARYLKQSPHQVFIILMVLAVIVHKLFCVETTLTKMLS